MKTQLTEELIDENQRLCRILNAAAKPAKHRAGNKSRITRRAIAQAADRKIEQV